ncbi:MAG: hypothetical protein U5N86_03460 [Planctomycetota bacterium]|nr:hypothetical protein [Planctomycetota bacterium]
MNPHSPLLAYFDKVFLVLALAAAVALLYFTFQEPERILSKPDINVKLDKLKNRLSSGGDLIEIENKYEGHAKRFSEAARIEVTPARASEWMYYTSPTPRPYVVVTTPPPPRVLPELSAVREFEAVSTPGKVVLNWKRPEQVEDILFGGYYLFKTTADEDFGFFVLDDREKVVFGGAARQQKPLLGPTDKVTFTDTDIQPETGYMYTVIAFGYPAKPKLENGKVVTDENGEPVMLKASEQPVVSVSPVLQGKTVRETQIFLGGHGDFVLGSFLVCKFDRESGKWLRYSFPSISVGEEIGREVQVGSEKRDFTTGWHLRNLAEGYVDVDGQRRKLVYAEIIRKREGHPRETRKLFRSSNTEHVEEQSVFEPRQEAEPAPAEGKKN